jgi:hypothetical protein
MTRRGPKTAAGKAIASRNALRHGVLSASPVVRGVEREEDWETHREGMVTSLGPQGYIETVLAERVALMSWRLQRVARYERDVIADSLESLDEPDDAMQIPGWTSDLRGSRPELEKVLAAYREDLCRVSYLGGLGDDDEVDAQDANWLVNETTDMLEVDPTEIPLEDIIGEDAIDQVTGWTAGLLRAVLRRLIESGEFEDHAGEAPTEPYAEQLHTRIDEVQERLAQLARAHHRRLRQSMLPDEETLAKITRYEAHLNRQMYQALHELEALQARRFGQAAPLARLEINASTAE